MLTVLLATRNRSQILRDVLECYCRIQPPSSGWKIVVADNGSTDATKAVLESFTNRLPLQSVFEPNLGKNFALNSGLDLAEGDLNVFTDDDAFPNPDWLVQLRQTADSHPEVGIFGGTILPRWEVPAPTWIRWLDLGPIFTLTDSWLKDGPVGSDELSVIQGPNMAVRASVFQAGTRFNTSIGPSGSDYAMGSETELIFRLARQGLRAWHVKDAVVEHFVRKEQMDKDWILRRAIRWGRGRQRMSPDVRAWLGVPLHLFRDIPVETLAVLGAAVTFRQKQLLIARWRLNILRGKWIEARILSRLSHNAGGTAQVSRRDS